MLFLSLLSSFAASEKIQCRECMYSYITEDTVTFNIGGDPACLSGPLDDFPVYESEKEGTNAGLKYRVKCVSVWYEGLDRFYYDDNKYVDTELNLVERYPWHVYEGSEFWDYDGDIYLESESYVCGANRTECSGDLRQRSMDQVNTKDLGECDIPNRCACPRCEWEQVKNNGAMTNLVGTVQCEAATEPGMDQSPCMYGPGLKSGPDSRRQRLNEVRNNLIQYAQKKIGNDVRGGAVGAQCLDWRDKHSMLEKPNDPEHQLLWRDCEQYVEFPLNALAILNLNADKMSICSKNKCNTDWTTGAASAMSVFIGFAFFLFL